MTNQKDQDRLHDLLGQDRAPEFEDSVWPGVRAAIRPRPRRPLLSRLALAGGGCAVTACGLLLGLGLGGGSGAGASNGATAAWENGSLVTDDAAVTIDALYGDLFLDQASREE